MLLVLLATAPPVWTTPQDRPGTPSEGRERRIRGQVRSDDDGATQLRRVRVAVIGATATPVFTDQEGRFEIAVPAPGAFTLRFSKAGFAPQEIAGARISDGGVQVRLARGAAVAGRVVDETGATVADVPVRVRSVGAVANQLPVSIATRTDDLGEFRIGSLPAGQYEAAVEDTSPRLTVNAAGGVTISRPPAPPPAGAPAMPAAPPPPVPGTIIIKCADSGITACVDLLARGGAVRAEPVTVAVQLRAGEDGGVTIVHEQNAAAVRGALEYSAGFAAGTAAAEAGTARSRARGTAVITGIVTSSDGRPVPGALARLSPATPGGAFGVVAAVAGGVFQFTGVAAGSYRLAAALNGFVIGEYGQARPGEPGVVLTVRDGQRIERADVTLHRGAIITGTVTDADGEPLEGLSMQVWRATSSGGRAAAEAVGDVAPRTTDDRGRYRIHGLQPGAYYVVASEPATPATTGPTRGTGLRGAPRAFYPGAPTLAQATPMRVGVGVDAIGADMTFSPGPAFRVSGIALDSDGDPITWPVALTASVGSGGVMSPPLSAPFALDGSFEFTHVPPGRYVLQAFQMATREFGRTFIEVADGDVGPVRLNVAPTSTISGRIVVNGATANPNLGDVRIDVLPADPDYLSQNALPRAAVFMLNTSTDSAGSTSATYEVRGLAGPVRFVDARVPAGWWLESVNIGGVNAADDPVLFEAPVDSRGDVEIVFSTNGAEVSGRAVDSRNEPAPTFVAVMFPVDRDRWYAGSRYVKSALAAEQGRFTIASLPPADYWVAAVEALPDGALRDPGVLEALTAAGRRVSLSAGERLVIDLPVVRLPVAAR